jgi:hypothetical protein
LHIFLRCADDQVSISELQENDGVIMGMMKQIALTLIMFAIMSQTVLAGDLERRWAKRIHDRLTGVPASNATIDAMEGMMLVDSNCTPLPPFSSDCGKSAATYAIDNVSGPPTADAFYNVTLKNWAAPWTNEEQTVFTPLNDYTATIIGRIRDGLDFRNILWDDILYTSNVVGISAYANNNNAHYEELEALGPVAGNLANSSILQPVSQSAATLAAPPGGVPFEATAGILTSRAASMSFFSDGTNRAMFRFTMMNHMCTDLEPLKDVSRTPDRVRQDVSRSPGGDSRIFLNACVGCHAGMDGMAGAFAHYEWNYTGDKSTGFLDHTPGAVSGKHLINSTNFEDGYFTSDDSWVNYWRNGQNWLLGWDTAVRPDSKGNETGNGARQLGQELANSQTFARCQVDKAFEAICLRGPSEFINDPVSGVQDRITRDSIVDRFTSSYSYNMREVFTDVAAHCKGN